MLDFLKVFEGARAGASRRAGSLAMAGRMVATVLLSALFMLTIYVLW